MSDVIYSYLTMHLGFMLIGLLVFTGIIFYILEKVFRKTLMYRKVLADLYVAAKIRAIAAKDNLDLNQEFNLFGRMSKKFKMEEMPLDVTIESELQDKITDEVKGGK